MKKHFWIVILTGSVITFSAVAVFASVLFGASNAKTNTISAISETVVKTPTISHVTSNASFKPETDSSNKEDVKPEPDISIDNDVKILFVGDIMLDRFVAERSRRAGTQKYPFLRIAGSETNFFDQYDLTVANLEGPVTAKRAAPNKGDVDFMFDPAIAPLLKEVGIDAVSQANNHTLDQGRSGADESRKLLAEAGLAVFGDQVIDSADSALTITDIKGTKVALLGFNITDNPLDKTEAEAALKSAYEQARYVIVYMHWGAEYQSTPNMTQIELAHWFIDQGVDAVIGAHPHWMQSVEVYNNRPIIYSLGNFIFDQDWSTETNYGLIAGLNISSDITEVQLFPIQLKASQPYILEGDDRQTRLDRLANISHESLKEQIKTGVITIRP